MRHQSDNKGFRHKGVNIPRTNPFWESSIGLGETQSRDRHGTWHNEPSKHQPVFIHSVVLPTAIASLLLHDSLVASSSAPVQQRPLFLSVVRVSRSAAVSTPPSAVTARSNTSLIVPDSKQSRNHRWSGKTSTEAKVYNETVTVAVLHAPVSRLELAG